MKGGEKHLKFRGNITRNLVSNEQGVIEHHNFDRGRIMRSLF